MSDAVRITKELGVISALSLLGESLIGKHETRGAV